MGRRLAILYRIRRRMLEMPERKSRISSISETILWVLSLMRILKLPG
jgi:hypothetical protein